MSDRNPYLLCDFHMHTTWSDGALTLRDLVDLYGRTGDFDVIAFTDHILREKDWLGRAGRLATLGRRTFSVTEKTFPAYLEAIREEAERKWREYELLVIPGAEVTKNHARARKNAHIVALGIERFISADQSPEDILREIRHSWKTLIRAEKSWLGSRQGRPAEQRRHRHHALSQRGVEPQRQEVREGRSRRRSRARRKLTPPPGRLPGVCAAEVSRQRNFQRDRKVALPRNEPPCDRRQSG